MAEEKYPKDLFLESIDRCMAKDDFITEFFHRFISSSEEVRKKFKYTDLSHLSWMLVRSVRIASGAIDGNPAALNELRQRAESHDVIILISNQNFTIYGWKHLLKLRENMIRYGQRKLSLRGEVFWPISSM